MSTVEPPDEDDLMPPTQKEDNITSTTNTHDDENTNSDSNLKTPKTVEAVSSTDTMADNDITDSLTNDVDELALEDDLPIDATKTASTPWYSNRKRNLRALREIDEDQRWEQRKLRQELRDTDWRRKLGKSSVIRVKLPSKSKYQCRVTSPLGFETRQQRPIDIGYAQRGEYMKKLQANVIKGTRKHLGLSSSHDDMDISPSKSVGCHDESYVFGSSTARADPRLGGKMSLIRRRKQARNVKRWRKYLLRNTKPQKTKINFLRLQRLLDSKGPKLWSIAEGGLGLRMPTPPTSAVTRGHIAVLAVDALRSFGLFRKYKNRTSTLIVFKELPKSRPLIHVRKNGRKSPFWLHRKKIKAFSGSSMSLLVLRVEADPDPQTAKFWVSLTAEGRGILEDCLRELEKQVFLSLRISTSQPETQWAAASSDAEFVSSTEHDPYESASTAMSSPERVSSPEQTEPEMYEDGEGELFF